MKKRILLTIFLYYWHFGFSQNVPDPYQALYATLDAKLIEIDQSLTIAWDGKKYCTNYCTSLMTANSGRGEALLEPKVLDNIEYYLDAFEALGVRAVDIAIQYPVLVTSFPKSQDYLNFYKAVVQKVRDHEFRLIIGCQSTFRDSIFGKLDVEAFYEGLDKARFKAEKKQMIETIINELKPDYLTIETEPSTQGMNLGLNYTVNDVVEYVQYFLNGLDKKGTLIGGGAGTWDEIDYIDAIAQLPEIDYIDYHIYPVIQDFFVDRVFKIDSIATRYQKKLVIGECWLHKADETDLQTLPAHVLFARDIFSFWIPLDSLFTECVVKLSHLSKCEVTSLIWATYLFSYMDYLPEHETMPLDQLYNMGYTASGPNMLSKTFSSTGALYHHLIMDACNATSIYLEGQINIPADFILEQNFPNPFNPSTTIRFSLSRPDDITLKVYDLRGKEVKSIFSGHCSAGISEMIWQPEKLSSGIYLVCLQGGNMIKRKKMILLK
ncbi:T9SS type A sorting domain-containing protein [bacterium]|nr:T9SS type A sorting domain-containing protein [bacterium]